MTPDRGLADSPQSATPRPPAPLRVFTSNKTRRSTVAFLAVLGVLFVVTTLALRAYAPGLSDPVALRSFVHSFGVLAPVAFVLLQAAQVVVAPIPGQLLGFAAGYLFGSLAGTAYSLTGAAIGSFIAFSLSRRYGRPYVESVVYGPTLDLFDDVCRERGLVALFVIFLVPGLPDDVLCLAAGLTDLDIKKMVVVSVVGRLPGYLLVAVAGANLAAGALWQTVAIVALLGIASVVGWLKRHAILRWLGAEQPVPDPQ